MTITRHMQMDRADRYAFIVTTIGVGEIVHTVHRESNKYHTPVTVNVTSTGVAVVLNEHGDLVTMYILRINEARTLFGEQGIPMVLEAKIKQNMRKNYDYLQNSVKF
jgi:hypothetical protein